MYDEIEEINTAIRSRPEGQRHATPAEAELRRKIITSIRAVKRQVSTPELYQALRAFVKYVTARSDRHPGLHYYIEEFIAGERNSGKHAPKPSEFEYTTGGHGIDLPEQDEDLDDAEFTADDPGFDRDAFMEEQMKKAARTPHHVEGFDLSPRAPRDIIAIFENIKKQMQKKAGGSDT